MTIEYDYIPGFDVGSDSRAFPEISENVCKAFEDTGTEFSPDRDENNPLPFWSAGVPDSRFPEEDDFNLRIYAKDHRNSLNGKFKNYHFLSVNYDEFNHHFATLAKLGKSIVSPSNNESPQPVEERYSFIWWGDIFENSFMTQLTAQEIREHAVEVATHELGHQRFALTHYEQQPKYHNPSQPYCVMQGSIDNIDNFHRLNPVFCFNSDSITTNSCRDWLEQANP